MGNLESVSLGLKRMYDIYSERLLWYPHRSGEISCGFEEYYSTIFIESI